MIFLRLQRRQSEVKGEGRYMNRRIDRTGVKIGMWLFLYSEIILFGGLFVLYAVYFYKYPQFFAEGGKELSRLIGTVNTVVLLVSSFTVAASITAIQRKAKKAGCRFSRFLNFLRRSVSC